ncbi:hypothetical protein [Escherichia coli]|uniref:hypothetical protein n=1 Tax=Escherichia coli TaxID=562 RepID=UPI001F4983B0|nr:hypothetical protein [Escherichia coli]MCH6911076.1 hypothetical protein [Escherichia coli]MEB8169971.1 hypothetical protein [Escherichia coli]HAV8365620.1 hypothetical protein [Escherichia coli]
MLTIILFGAGWKGDVLDLERCSPVIKAPDQTFRLLKSSGGTPTFEDAEFEVFEYQLGDEIYLVGFHGNKPSDNVIKSHIQHGDPKPKPYKTL